MKIAKKARRWVAYVGNGINLDKTNKESLKRVFKASLDSLPDSPLKTELSLNYTTYLHQLFENFNIMVRDEPQPETILEAGLDNKDIYAKPLPYSLYGENKHKLKKKICAEFYKDEGPQIYSAYLSQMLPDLTDTDAIVKLLKHCQSTNASRDLNVEMLPWLADIRTLSAIWCHRDEPTALQHLMTIFQRHVTNENISGKLNRLQILKEEILNFVLFCHVKPKSAKKFSRRPSYEDLLAAILSVLVDVVVVASRSLDDVEMKSYEGKRLCTTVVYLLDHSRYFCLDVVIQASTIESADFLVVGPLLRKVLERPAEGDHEIYSKYIAAVFQYKKLFNGALADAIATAMGVPAPRGYIDWLQERGPDVYSELPVTKRFKGTSVTRFLLEEATDDVISGLLDILTVTEEELGGEEVATLDHAMLSDDRGYFYIDQTGDVAVNDFEAMEVEEDADEPTTTKETELLLFIVDRGPGKSTRRDDEGTEAGNDGGETIEESRKKKSKKKKVPTATLR